MVSGIIPEKPYTTFTGLYIVPGLIDAHVHIESSLLTPREYARLVALHGTTTVIADPHEIANVAGTAGLEFMLAEREGAATDIRYMLPSCVPATPTEAGGAILDAADLRPFIGREGVLGLGEMMNVPGVLAGDPGIREKLALSPIRDGHAPLLSGKDLNAYILAGLQSDHECTTLAEAKEKLERGMYIFIREGSTERNIAALIPLVSPATVSRCCFATDDCHADLLDGERAYRPLYPEGPSNAAFPRNSPSGWQPSPRQNGSVFPTAVRWYRAGGLISVSSMIHAGLP